MMRTWGAEVFPSPTSRTQVGRSILEKDPRTNGSLGMAISEAVEDAATHDDTKYSLGSVLNHVCMHQTVIGLEAQEQMKMAGEYPDVVIGCHGGGSNFSRETSSMAGAYACSPPSPPAARRSPRASTPSTTGTPPG
jgi:tryptophan synthase beta chain